MRNLGKQSGATGALTSPDSELSPILAWSDEAACYLSLHQRHGFPTAHEPAVGGTRPLAPAALKVIILLPLRCHSGKRSKFTSEAEQKKHEMLILPRKRAAGHVASRVRGHTVACVSMPTRMHTRHGAIRRGTLSRAPQHSQHRFRTTAAH
ncbi:hypothetical protein AAFF_G00375530 [Aldrovandia affinis]|uniref:Uncharacterized protein n=1 Tax=Aldrovandia affinis TaxID=143900 RepID=A0AAD7SGA3_9TELE|nr:hypothetical protein AAFF_G00375530 [Aldrovandia affinis]